MTDIKKEDVVKWLSGQSVLVISELVKELEEAWGVSATAPVAVAAVPAGGDRAAAAEEEKDSFDVILKSFGENKIATIKVVREITALGLKEAKELVESAPKPVKEGVSKDDVKEIEEKLKAVGADFELK